MQMSLDPSVLAEVLELAARVRRDGVVVFDLDSTLLDNRPRQARILREFGEAHGIAPLAGARADHWDGWDLKRAMAATGLAPTDVERWADEAKAFWKERFFTSEYCAGDDAIAGAVTYVNAVVARGAHVAYCTGRHEEMRAGSVASFVRLGFPLPGDGVHLLMKPTLELHDDVYKETAYAELRRIGRVLAVFDNEPTHVNGYRVAFPEARAVHLATDHSGRPVALLDGIVSVYDFNGGARPRR
jgi:hypothetical protein